MTELTRAIAGQASSDMIRVQRKCACGARTNDAEQCPTCNATGRQADNLAESLSASIGAPLDHATQQRMGGSFNSDFSSVRIHADPASYRAASALDARAFTVGQDIYFASGENVSSSGGDSRLLAHELSHVVQQRPASRSPATASLSSGNTSEASLEVEADRAADAVMAGRPPRVSRGAATPGMPLRQKAGSAQGQPKVVQPVDPNARQQKAIDDARRAAAIRTQRAGFKARGIEGAQDFMEARRLAQIKFDWADPNMDQVGEILGNMGALLPSVSVKVAGAGDPECGNRDGYVRGHSAPIVLCPRFFTSTPEERTRTMVHEAAHVVGIGSADVSEQYFVVFDCDSKGDFSAADSWANYVNCLSGQPADKPPTITGGAGASQQNPGKKP